MIQKRALRCRLDLLAPDAAVEQRVQQAKRKQAEKFIGRPLRQMDSGDGCKILVEPKIGFRQLFQGPRLDDPSQISRNTESPATVPVTEGKRVRRPPVRYGFEEE
ncbi:hypothetical protein ACJJTC_003128 [Scirpophaga incertulas]